MARKFIELKEAAKQLGITPDRLLELRDSGDVHGYRDGATWKFKVEEIDQLAASLPSAQPSDVSASDSAPLSGDDLDSLLQMGVDSDSDEGLDGSSILISEEAKGNAEGGSSTVIGKEKESEGEKADSDLKLADETPKSGDSDVSLVPDSDGSGDVKIVADDSDKPGTSDSDLKLADSEDMSDELELSSELDFDSDDALMLGEDSELKLAADDDGVLDDSSGSEIALGASDSGVVLSSPSDSGLSLEEQPQEDSSSGALELPEDDEMISLEDDDLVASPDDATQLQQDEEFLLSPSDEMLGDESSDSGSQVIALEESDSFAEETAGVVADSEEPILEPEESSDALEAQLEAFDGATSVETGAVPVGVDGLPEAPYSIWNIVSLLAIILLLSVTGMLMTDVIRNMWTWNGAGGSTSTIADAIVSMFRMN